MKRTLAFILIALAGCGYQFQGAGTTLPEDVRKIALLPVENMTTENGLGVRMSESMRSRLERYGVVQVVENAGEADATMRIRVKTVDSRVRNVSGTQDVGVDSQLVLALQGELKRKNGQILWRDEDMRVSEAFADVSGAVVTSSSDFLQGGIDRGSLSTLTSSEVSRGQRSDVLERLVEEATRQIYNEAVAADF